MRERPLRPNPLTRRTALGRVARAGLIVTAVLIGLSPIILAMLPACGLKSLLGAWFSFQCHQDTDRGLRLLGAQIPVCARCLGLYLGLATGAALGRPRLSHRGLAIWLGIAAVVLVGHVLLAKGTPLDAAPFRLLCGLALSHPIGAFAANALFAKRRPEVPR